MSSIELPVLYRDNFLCIIDKPAGVPSQPDPTGDLSAQQLVQQQLDLSWLGLVHRLDRPVSGALIFALDEEVLRQLNTMFKHRRVQKTYWAIVEGGLEWQEKRLETWLKHDERGRKAQRMPVGKGEKAVLVAKRLVRGDRYSLVEVTPEGGAFHQIRAQLAAEGHPIKGDVKYGARRAERGEAARTIALHARSLAFHHPMTDQYLHVVANDRKDGIWPALIALMNA